MSLSRRISEIDLADLGQDSFGVLRPTFQDEEEHFNEHPITEYQPEWMKLLLNAIQSIHSNQDGTEEGLDFEAVMTNRINALIDYGVNIQQAYFQRFLSSAQTVNIFSTQASYQHDDHEVGNPNYTGFSTPTNEVENRWYGGEDGSRNDFENGQEVGVWNRERETLRVADEEGRSEPS